MKKHLILALIFVIVIVAGCASAPEESGTASPAAARGPLTGDDFPAAANACGHTIEFGTTTVGDLEAAGFVVESTEDTYPDNQIWEPEIYHMCYGETRFAVLAYSPYVFRFENIDGIPHRVIRGIMIGADSETADGAVTYLGHVFSALTPERAADWAAALEHDVFDVHEFESQIFLDVNGLEACFAFHPDTGETRTFLAKMTLTDFLDLQPDWTGASASSDT